MKKSEIKVGKFYLAKVNNRVVPVRVDDIRDTIRYVGSASSGKKAVHTRYYVTNLIAKRSTVFDSAMKFREEITEKEVQLRTDKLGKLLSTAGQQSIDGPVMADPKLEDEQRPDPTQATTFKASRVTFQTGSATTPAAVVPPVSSSTLREDKVANDPANECSNEEPDCCEGEPGELCPGCGKIVPLAKALKEGEKGADPTLTTGEPIQMQKPSATTSDGATVAKGMGGSLAEKLNKPHTPPAGTPPHLIVIARAGTGKTTTLVSALQVLKGLTPKDAKGNPLIPSPQQKAVWDAVALSRGKANTVAFVAFNRSIAEELRKRVPQGCDAMTMHSLGLKAITRAYGRGIQVSDFRVPDMIANLMGFEDPRELRKRYPTLAKPIEHLVNLCKMNLVMEATEKALEDLANHYDVDFGEGSDANFNWAKACELIPTILERCRDPKRDGRIDYADMIWLPVVNNLPLFRYDLLMVDEAQDLNRCQQELAKRSGHRLVLCGDPKQAIYGFAGACEKSMEDMRVDLSVSGGCVTLPLTVTRRCGKAIVAEARKYVDDFEAFETNPEGKVYQLLFPRKAEDEKNSACYTNHVREGDFVLCRVNAPLASQCFRFIRAGRKANIQGRDIGQGLISTIKKLNASSVPDLVGKVTDWVDRETMKEQAKRNPSEDKLIIIQDRADCILVFTENATSVDEVIRRIEDVFTDDKTRPGIRLSSIHKAKGLEAHRVFLLQPKGGSVPHPMAKGAWQKDQEINLLYVAITRAIDELYFVYERGA